MEGHPPLQNGRKHHATRAQALWDERLKWVPRGLFQYHSLCMDGGRNAILEDVDGRTYIDFAGGIGALNVGHCHPAVVEAIRRQAGLLLHTCAHVAPVYGYAKVCERLCHAAPGSHPKKAALFNSGAEAVENAVKIARAYTGRHGVVAFDHSFHGRTFLALSLTGKHRPYRQRFGPFPGDVYRVPYPYPYRPPAGVRPAGLVSHCLERLESLFVTSVPAESVAAVIVKPVLGEGGFVVPPPVFLPALRRLCDTHGILLIADEIQTGFGRTGRFFAVEHSGVVPDLITVAKSLAAGLPLSAVVGRAEVMDAVEPGGLGGTYGGNPVSCAAAMAVFDVMERERLVERAVKVGDRIARRFESLARSSPLVGEARGLGAMRALELVRDRGTREPLPEPDMARLLRLCADRGLLAIKAGPFGNVLRVLAPLTIPWEDLDRGLGIMASVIEGFAPASRAKRPRGWTP